MQRRTRLIALMFVMLVAVLFRTVGLGSVPLGLDPDEALNGNQGFEAAQTHEYRVFYPLNNGREGLFINLIGVSESAFGAGLAGLRIPAAVIGSLTVLFVFLLGELMVGWRAALFGSFLLATSFWHVTVSRTAFRAILMPLLLTASLYLLLKAFRANSKSARLWWAAAGGLLYGLGFHSYIAYRISPLVAITFACAELWRRRRSGDSPRPWAVVMAVWGGAAVAAALPMVLYFVHHQADFSGRMNELSVLHRAHPARALWNGTRAAVMQFNVRGDSDWGLNISCAPLLLWPVGVLFVLGVALAVWAVVRRKAEAIAAALLLVWLVVMLAPTAISGDTSALRTLGTVAPVFLLTGWAAAWIYARLRWRVARVLLVALMLATGGVEAYRYFGVWAHSPGTARDLHAQAVREGLMLNELPLDTPRYVVVDRDDDDLHLAYRNVDGTQIALPYTGGDIVLLTRQHRVPAFLFEDEAAHTRFPSGSVLVQMYPSKGFFAGLERAGVRLHTAERDGVPYAVIE
jgi:4-amino-4-deoxy-L-arabinose transferase-like glycosyltransferase